MTRAQVDRIGDAVHLILSAQVGQADLVLSCDHARELGKILIRKASDDAHDALDDLVERCNT